MRDKNKIEKMLKELKVKAPTFAKSIGVDYQRVYDIIREKTQTISADLGVAISQKYPQYPLDWLLSRDGDVNSGDIVQKIGDVHGGIGAIGRVGGNASIGVPDAEAVIAENALLREQNKKLLDQVIKLTERVGTLTDRLIEK